MYDDFINPKSIDAPCGATAYFDIGSGIGYRCEECEAIIGSIGMPRECRTLLDMDTVAEKLKGEK